MSASKGGPAVYINGEMSNGTNGASSAAAAASAAATTEFLSEKESDLYDRQIRLWGVEAQRRMSSCKVLFLGFRGVAAEAAKNIVLAGFNVTVQDSALVSPEDLGANFFLSDADIGKERAVASQPPLQELNTLATVQSCTTPIDDLEDSFLSSFNVICMQGATLGQQLRVDAVCRQSNTALYVAETFGYMGCIFLDLGKHTYRNPIGDNNVMSDPITVEYSSLEQALVAPWSSLKDRWGPVPKAYVMQQLLFRFEERQPNRRRPRPGVEEDRASLTALAKEMLVENGMDSNFITEEELGRLIQVANAELSPVCAVLGGILGQEIVKYVSQKNEPAKNVFIFDGTTFEGIAFQVPKN